MSERTPADGQRWSDQGTALVDEALAGLTDEQLAEASALPGWTRKHLVAHLAGNAEALRNLVQWAATGDETPMYSSPQQRNADIESGALREPGELRGWYGDSARSLAADIAALPSQAWSAPIRTAQGRNVPFSEVPWMRAREVMIHAVDLGTGLRIADLPTDFLVALVADIVGKRSTAGTDPALALTATDTGDTWQVTGEGDPVEVTGPVADLAAYLSGRPGAPVTTTDGSPAPQLSRWL